MHVMWPRDSNPLMSCESVTLISYQLLLLHWTNETHLSYWDLTIILKDTRHIILNIDTIITLINVNVFTAPPSPENCETKHWTGLIFMVFAHGRAVFPLWLCTREGNTELVNAVCSVYRACVSLTKMLPLSFQIFYQCLYLFLYVQSSFLLWLTPLELFIGTWLIDLFALLVQWYAVAVPFMLLTK